MATPEINAQKARVVLEFLAEVDDADNPVYLFRLETPETGQPYWTPVLRQEEFVALHYLDLDPEDLRSARQAYFDRLIQPLARSDEKEGEGPFDPSLPY